MLHRVGHALVVLLVAATTTTPPASAVPPSAYHFVDPPSAFAAGNVAPRDFATTIALGAKGSVAAHFATTDRQVVVTLPAGAIAPRRGATSIAVRVTPLAPRHLAPVPDDLRANGNAYRVDMTYEPSGTAVTQLAQPGAVQLAIPETGVNLFVSPDARTWATLGAAVAADRRSLTASFVAPGYYLAATDQPLPAAAAGSSHHTAVIVGAVLAVAALGALAFATRRRRRPASG